jgi:hypothetical protein
MATKKVARSRAPKKPRGERSDIDENVTLSKRAIYRTMCGAVDALVVESNNMLGIAESLRESGGISFGGSSDELQKSAGLVKAHAHGLLQSVMRVAAKAERIATMADVRASAGAE